MGEVIVRDSRSKLPEGLITRALGIDPATIGHLREEGFVAPEIKPVFGSVKIAGPALTVRIIPPDGSAVHHTVSMARPGDVLVVETGGVRHACWGEGTSLAAQVRKVAGVTIDGPATDVQGIRRLSFPVFCRGVSPLATKQSSLGDGASTAYPQSGTA